MTDFAAQQQRMANFVSVEHNIPLSVAQAILHTVNLQLLVIGHDEIQEAHTQGIALLWDALCDPLQLDVAKMERAITEIVRMYGESAK